MTPPTIPPAVLNQHIAVLGKTGSGKTSTAKYLIEQVVAAGHRVCILDPIKSDWWGLTSSADGRRPGLNFSILGGPRGHVPLHASAGKAVAEVVASSELPLSIVDMADFEPGGQAKFFTEFAPALLRKMRGVVYLVIEEAHLFAPKERSGIGAENLSIHWAKTMATAGRSKGIRLVLVTQRTQALHNALLGSCDTLIAHRLTAPADQAPVIQWLKANASKGVLEQVTASLASMPTGVGWLCSGEARRFEAVSFPRIATFDNTATPTGNGQVQDVMTAPIDRGRLRDLIGEAVNQAEADDPRALRRRIADLESQIGNEQLAATDRARVDVPVLREHEIDRLRAVIEQFDDAIATIRRDADEAVENIRAAVNTADEMLATPLLAARVEIVEALRRATEPTGRSVGVGGGRPNTQSGRHAQGNRAGLEPPTGANSSADRPAGGSGAPMSRMHRAFLTALAQHGQLAKKKILIYSGYRSSGDTSTAFSALVQAGWCTAPQSSVLAITPAGRTALGPVEPLPTGKALRDRVLSEAGGLKTVERAMLAVLFQSYPKDVAKADILERAKYRSSGDTSTAFSHLVGLDYAVASGVSRLKAADVFFEVARG